MFEDLCLVFRIKDLRGVFYVFFGIICPGILLNLRYHLGKSAIFFETGPITTKFLRIIKNNKKIHMVFLFFHFRKYILSYFDFNEFLILICLSTFSQTHSDKCNQY